MTASTLRYRIVLGALAPLFVLSVLQPSCAHEGTNHEQHQATAAEPLKRKQVRYEIPDVMLLDATGSKVSLRAVLADESPLMLNFIFTSCTSICPVMSGVFSQVQSRLNKQSQKVRMVSISIDPEHDTPARLAAYAKNFSAGPEWIILTGVLKDSIAVQRAFDAYRGDKMNHEPITYLHSGAAHQPWQRIDGLASADQLLAELGRLTEH